jgi:hypothetical protein
MCIPENFVWRTFTNEKSDKNSKKLTSPEMVSNSKTDPHSRFIHKRFLVTYTTGAG